MDRHQDSDTHCSITCFLSSKTSLHQVPGYSEFAGVFQRLSIVSGFGWLTLLAIYFRKERSIK